MVDLKDEIWNAIGAHGLWKAELLIAISSGKLATPLEVLSSDKACEFGKWLIGPDIPDSEKKGAHFEKVRSLHSEFHKTVATVAVLALNGKKDEAVRNVEHGAFNEISLDLTQAMLVWMEDIK